MFPASATGLSNQCKLKFFDVIVNAKLKFGGGSGEHVIVTEYVQSFIFIV